MRKQLRSLIFPIFPIICTGLLLFPPIASAATWINWPVKFAAKHAQAEDGELILVLKSAPDAAGFSELRIRSPQWADALFRCEGQQVADLPKDLDVTVVAKQASRVRILVADSSGRVYDPAAHIQLLLPDKLAELLSRLSRSLRFQHYGALVPWDEASRLVPRMAKTEVMDVLTGLTFSAQRRAGSSHADFQPLTKEDTDTMRQIYTQGWSWDRRAVLVKAPDGGWLAASMNGMPHGGDGIPENGFSGHFCIHFYQSKTHGSDQVDLMHQAMVFRAAGKLPEYVRTLEPLKLAELYVAGLHQRDLGLMMQLLPAEDGKPIHPIAKQWDQLTDVRLLRKPAMAKSDSVTSPEGDEQAAPLRTTITLQLAVTWNGSRTADNERLMMICERRSPDDPWEITKISEVSQDAREAVN
ncbi:MAG: hypothetical protein K0R75_3880 [Paenibacillaceae bacterium]|nr:hypothetical protein [Paenibacillaceae bacterium]